MPIANFCQNVQSSVENKGVTEQKSCVRAFFFPIGITICVQIVAAFEALYLAAYIVSFRFLLPQVLKTLNNFPESTTVHVQRLLNALKASESEGKNDLKRHGCLIHTQVLQLKKFG